MTTSPTAALARIRQMADHWEQHLPEVIRTPAVVSALRAALESAVPVSSPPADRAALRDRIAEVLAPHTDHRHGLPLISQGLFCGWTPASDVADAVLAVLPQPADQAAVIRWCADAIDTETRQAKTAGVLEPDKYRPCRDATAQLRRMADETPAATETQRHDDTGPVKDSSRRYAEKLRSTRNRVVADGHTGWECDAGASLIVEASTPGPGKLGTHHGVIYACAVHRATAVERITAAGYEVDPQPAPPGHRWDPWPCGHVTAHDAETLTALATADGPAAGAQQDGARP